MANGSEVGSAHVSIFADMKGFRSTVLKEIQGSGNEGSSLFGRLFKGVGSKTGGDLGKTLKSSFDGSTGDLGAKAISKLKSEVSSAAKSMSGALLKQQDSAGAVRVAQAKLNEAVAKYGEGSSQAIAASEKLASAQRREQAASETLTAAQERLKSAKQAVAGVKAATVEAPKTSLFTNAIDRIKSAVKGLGDQKLDGAAKSVNGLGSTYEKVSGRIKASTVAIGSLIASGVRSVVNYGQSAIEAYNTASAATAKFQQIASNNKWSQTQISGLLDLNKNLGKTGVISAGTLKAAQAQLGTFALSAGSIKTLTPALSDLIANQKGYNATSDDGVTLANLLGKVMTGNAGALTKYGVTLDANQKKLLTNGTEAQRAATAAKVLEQNFGGVNSALGKTPYGKYVIMQHQLAAIKTTIGSGFITAIGSLGDLGINVVDGINDRLQTFFKWLPNAVSGAVDLLKTGKVSGAFKTAFAVSPTVATNIENVANRIRNAVKGVVDFVKHGTFNSAFKTAFQGMDSGTVKRFEDALSGVRDTLLGVGRNAVKSGGQLHSGMSGMDIATRGVQTLTSTLNILKPTIEIISNIAKAFASLPAPVQGAIGVTAIFAGKLSSVITPVSGVVRVLGEVSSGIGSVSSAIGGLISKRLSKTQELTGLADTLEDTASNATSAAGSLGTTASSVSKVGHNAESAASKTGGLLSSVGGFSPVGLAFGVAAAGVGVALAGMADDAEKTGQTVSDLKTAMQDGDSSAQKFFTQLRSGSEGSLGFWDKFNSGQGVLTNGTLAKAATAAGISMNTVEQAVKGSGSAMQEISGKAGNWWAQFTSPAASSANVVKGQINSLRDAYKDTIDQMVDYTNTAQGISSAQTAVSSAFSELSTTLKANGDDLSNNNTLTAASSQAIQQSTDALMVNVQQQLAYGAANGTVAQSTQAARNEVQQMRDSLMQTLEGMGMSEQAAGQYADKLGLIPRNVGTTITENSNMTKGEVQAYLDTLNLTPRQKTTVMNALTAQANGDVNNLHANYRNLPREVKSILTADNNDAVNKAHRARNAVSSVPESHTTNFFAQMVGSAWSNIKNFVSSASGHSWFAQGGLVHRAQGGAIRHLDTGGPSGYVTGPGSTTSDSIPTMLSDQEYVIRAWSAKRIGIGKLDAMNRTGSIPSSGGQSDLLQRVLMLIESGALGSRVNQTINYPAIAPTAVRTNEKLQTAAMPEW